MIIFVEIKKMEENKFDFEQFLTDEKFIKDHGVSNMGLYEFEKEEEEEETLYFAITIHQNNLMTSASSNREDLFNKDVELPKDKESAEKFLKEFLK